MTGPAPLRSFAEIAGDYPAVLCDVWGVIHDSIVADLATADALTRYREGGGRVILMTNAPRESRFVLKQFEALGVPPSAYDGIVSSGDVTRADIARRGPIAVFYTGRDSDRVLVEGLPVRLVAPEEAEAILCAGFFDDETETPEDYRERFRPLAERRLELVCANPDIVVERGERLVHCAGSLAALYAKLGGPVSQYGKPYQPIYDAALDKLAALAGRPLASTEVLVIGDGLPTDISGANRHGFPALFITGGIHAEDLHENGAPNPCKVAARLAAEGMRVSAWMPRLVW